MKILIVEDDRTLNNGVALSLAGEELLQAYDLETARRLWDETIDLILLDINLPDGNGVDFCREIRKVSSVPIIFLTANDMELDIVTGLESGGDDYITKPFSLAVLRARVNVIARRKRGQRKEAAWGKVYASGDFVFDFENMRFTAAGEAVELSKTEQRLLRLLVQNKGQTLSRNLLLDRVWSDGGEFVEENALSVAVSRLREKLPGIGIKTVYGIGYQYKETD